MIRCVSMSTAETSKPLYKGDYTQLVLKLRTPLSHSPCLSSFDSTQARAVLAFLDYLRYGVEIMDATPLIERVLEDEGITSGLEESEAALMVKLLTNKVGEIAAGTNDAASARQRVDGLCRNARRIGRVVECYRDEGEASARLKAEQFAMRWPDDARDSSALLQGLLGQ